MKTAQFTKEELEQLRQQAIEANKTRICHLQTFLNGLDLSSDVNKCVALELGSSITFVEIDNERLENLDRMTEHEIVWREFWAHICAPKGVLVEEQVKKELYDYKLMLDEVPTVYDTLAGLSKPHTSAKVIIDCVNARMIDKQMAFDDLTASAENGEVTLSVAYLKEYFDIE